MSDTAYALTAPPFDSRDAALPERTDVVIVGGGLTGLSAALTLADAGRDVTVLEARQIGEGASGRSGGQLHPGQRRDQLWLTERLGAATADRLWQLGEEAVAHVHTLRVRFGDPCGYRPGLIDAAHSKAAFADAVAYVRHIKERYRVNAEVLERDVLAAAIGTSRYVGGVRDLSGGHLNPLAFTRTLARAAQAAGARIINGARVTALSQAPVAVTVARQRVAARSVLLAGNGYLSGLDREVDRKILPLVNHIVATGPLPPLIPGGEAVSDTRRVVRYFRQDGNGRLIFGGGESFVRSPADVAAFVRPYLAEVYPALRTAPIEAAWSGTLGITATRCPLIRRLAPGLYVAAGYSGQGVGLAPFCGHVIARAILGDEERLDTFAKLPVPPLPGGPHLKAPLALLAMTWFSLRDRLGI